MLITDAYKQQVCDLHATTPGWGTTGRNFAPIVNRIVGDYAIQNILDYGCGKQTLARALPQYRIIGYDPGLPGLDAPPQPADLVVCTDVLEHIEPECLEDVLDDLQRVTRKCGFFTVATTPAIQQLPDGRNAHLVVEGMRWWLPKLWERFDLISFNAGENGFQVLVGALKPVGNGRT